MTTHKDRDLPRVLEKPTQVFPDATALDAKEIGVTLKIGDETLRKLDEIQEETIKAAQENEKFAWR